MSSLQQLRQGAARTLIKRNKARSSLLNFSMYTMDEYQPYWYHELISDMIQRMIFGDLRRLIISLPPRHGKSELISRRLPAYLLGHDPDASIITASYSSDLAGRMNRDVQRIIMDEKYKTIFPETTLNNSNVRTISGGYLRNSDLFEIVGKKGVYRSAGIGGGITGMGGKWLIVDDPVKNREEADSTTYRNATWNWYTSTFSTRQEADARILIIMTRWHSDDLVGRLLNLAETTEGADQWEVVNLPAIATAVPACKFDRRIEGEALWPEKYDIAKLNQMRATIGEYQFSALYQQAPRSGGGTEWPDSYFPDSIWFDYWPNTIVLRTIAVDPSKGAGGKHGDYSAIVKLGRDTDGVLYCEADLARRNSEDIIDTTLEIQAEFAADAVAIETNQFQELLATQLNAKASLAGYAVPIVKIVNVVNKQTRIRRLGPFLAGQKIRFKSKCVSTRLLIEQLKDFPTATHDDGPDALEMALRAMIELHNGRHEASRNIRGLKT